ncbi:hypothetical protein JF66_12410 [Cryobacterium sp. MLB-32]|uniref:mevalonate kinase family protein n=1 Tax=Cryobacterium sp. MLB-32 TaxID=1529318 RepID=UPI0004E667D7|nr:hypothetical protein [Cryobacterium sp. MLB-32]KFF59286.1 hypothetical protein JF66_12410 [Cryobacterium sp. MLB-32]
MRIRTSAPGKLFLLGEYAVLSGAPALLTAVDRRVDVSVDDSTSDSWQVHAPNLGLENLVLGTDGELPSGLDPRVRSSLRVFDAVREAVLGVASLRPRPLAISIDSSAFSVDGHKLGLGSSAAVAAALTAALGSAVGLEQSKESVFRLADAAHRNAQGGVGSGGDVAASVYGGLIGYRQGAIPVPLHWPEELDIMAVVTGEGSLTTRLVAGVADYAAENPTGHRADIARLSALAERATAALADPDEFLSLANGYFSALSQLDAHAHVGIVSARHRELHELATREGGAFKTSGAGGGDVGLAFSHRGEPSQRLAAALTQAGAAVVPLGFLAAGLQEDPTS